MRDAFKVGVVVLFFALLGIGVATASYQSMPATELHTDQNESVTQDIGNWVRLSETFGEEYFDNETVRNESGDTLVEGNDYEYEPTNQSIKFLTSANTTDTASAAVDYPFKSKPRMARASIGLVGGTMQLLGVTGVMTLFVIGLLNVLNRFRSPRRWR